MMRDPGWFPLEQEPLGAVSFVLVSAVTAATRSTYGVHAACRYRSERRVPFISEDTAWGGSQHSRPRKVTRTERRSVRSTLLGGQARAGLIHLPPLTVR